MKIKKLFKDIPVDTIFYLPFDGQSRYTKKECVEFITNMFCSTSYIAVSIDPIAYSQYIKLTSDYEVLVDE